MKRVYVAGAISSDDPVKMLGNIKKGLCMSAYLIAKGYFVFSPFLDFQLFLGAYGEEITKKQIQANSMAWLEVSDSVLVLAGWKESTGTKREIKRARELGIPVYYDREKMEKEIK